MAKTTKRGNGEGSIYKRKDGKWCATITTGKNELIVKNVTDSCVLPKREKKDIHVLSLEEQRALIKALDGEELLRKQASRKQTFTLCAILLPHAC